jgi:ABC-type arginine/histidine transport system permease subunit
MLSLQCLAISAVLAFLLSIPLLLPERRRKTSNDLTPVKGEITVTTKTPV